MSILVKELEQIVNFMMFQVYLVRRVNKIQQHRLPVATVRLCFNINDISIIKLLFLSKTYKENYFLLWGLIMSKPI